MSWTLGPFFGSPSNHAVLKRTQASLHASVIPSCPTNHRQICVGNRDIRHQTLESAANADGWGSVMIALNASGARLA
jgi:hypothetical protein